MKTNKGYIVTIYDSAFEDEFWKIIASSEHYIQPDNIPLLIYHDKNQLDKIDTSVRIGFNMNGFIIVAIKKASDEEDICKHVLENLNNYGFISQILNENESIRAFEINFNEIRNLIKEVNFKLDIAVKSSDIVSIAEIKIQEEKMDIEKLVNTTVKDSLSFLLIKNGKLVKSNNISAPTNEVKDFAITSHLSAIMLNKFIGIHSDFQGKKVASISMHDNDDKKIVLFKQLEDNHNLIFDCTQNELEDAKQSIKELDDKVKKGRTEK
jgi:hypothetical protein